MDNKELKERKIVIEFRPFKASNIQCFYDLGEHPNTPVWERCERCWFTMGVSTPLCQFCGFNFEVTEGNWVKVCNTCYESLLGNDQTVEIKKLTA